jgi:hypothetical protein
MDLDRPDAIERKVEMYNPPDGERIERYFAVLDRIRSGSANLNKPLSGKSATNNARKWA